MKKKTLAVCLAISSSLLFAFRAEAGMQAKDNPQILSIPDRVPLKLRYRVGEQLYYRLTRLNNNFRSDGTKAGEQRVAAYFTRVRLPDDDQGRVRERFTWKSFQFGQSVTAAPAKLSVFKEAEDFSLEYSVNEELAIEKFDFSSLPRTMAGFMFMILSWDAVTFDGLVRPTPALLIPDEAPVGAEFLDQSGPRDFRFSFPPLVTDAKYSFSGKGWVKLAGLSRIGSIPCALMQAGQSENRVEMSLHFKPLEIKIRGFEHFWAQTYLSLEDGRIIRGELVGPVVMAQDIQSAGEGKPEHSELLAIGYLNMDLLSEAEFRRAINEIKGSPRAER